MEKRIVKISKRQLNEAVAKSVRKILEAFDSEEDGYYKVETDEAQEACDLFRKYLGTNEANEEIVTSLGYEKLAESMEFLFERYGFKYWKRYLEEKENGVTVSTFEFD